MVASKKGRETPAEQLLRMIEGSPATAEGLPKAAAVPMWRRLQEACQDFLGQVLQAVMPRRDSDPFLWNVRLAHRALWIVLAGLGAYTAIDLFLVKPKPKLTRTTVLSVQRSAAPAAAPADGVRPLSTYVDAITQRNPFATKSQSAESKGASEMESLTSGLTVVGIDRGPNPVALIENAAQQKTYVVRVGDEINGMVVKKISSEGVLLNYEGKEILVQ